MPLALSHSVPQARLVRRSLDAALVALALELAALCAALRLVPLAHLRLAVAGLFGVALGLPLVLTQVRYCLVPFVAQTLTAAGRRRARAGQGFETLLLARLDALLLGILCLPVGLAGATRPCGCRERSETCRGGVCAFEIN